MSKIRLKIRCLWSKFEGQKSGTNRNFVKNPSSIFQPKIHHFLKCRRKQKFRTLGCHEKFVATNDFGKIMNSRDIYFCAKISKIVLRVKREFNAMAVSRLNYYMNGIFITSCDLFFKNAKYRMCKTFFSRLDDAMMYRSIKFIDLEHLAIIIILILGKIYISFPKFCKILQHFCNLPLIFLQNFFNISTKIFQHFYKISSNFLQNFFTISTKLLQNFYKISS